MPTYEYACDKCGEHLEVVQSFRDEPLKRCTSCGGRLRKVFSPVGIVFKGSGFYKTDSRDKKTTKAESSSGDSGSKSSSDTPSSEKSSSEKSSSEKSSTKTDGSKDKPSPKSEKPAKTSSAAAS
jgi:putative FmdB family regulatory protein